MLHISPAQPRTGLSCGSGSMISVDVHPADLTQWSQEGIGGFAANVGLLTGMGGTQKFTADPNADLSSSPYVIEDQNEELQYCGGGSHPGDEALPGPRPHELLQHRYAIGGLVRRFGLVQHRSSPVSPDSPVRPTSWASTVSPWTESCIRKWETSRPPPGREIPGQYPLGAANPERGSRCGGSNSWPRFCKPSRTCRSPTTPPGSPTPGTPMSSIRARMSRTPMTATSRHQFLGRHDRVSTVMRASGSTTRPSIRTPA